MSIRSSVRSGAPSSGPPGSKLTAEMEGFVAGIHASKYLNPARRKPILSFARSQAAERCSDRLYERTNLKEALRQVRGNKGGAGVDRMTVDHLATI
jgi:hypothetical protein